MFFIEDIERLFNCLAELIFIIENDGVREAQLRADPEYKKTKTEYDKKLEDICGLTPSGFLDELENVCKTIKHIKGQSCSCAAYAVCQYVDLLLTYNSEGEWPKYISLYPKVPITESVPVSIGSLNTNYEETKIWINPKLNIHEIFDEEDHTLKKNPIIRSSCLGINGALKNIAYYRYDGSYRINNVIISETNLYDKYCKYLDIAFAPMSSERNLVKKKKDVKIQLRGRTEQAVELELTKGFDFFSQRLEDDWISAARNGADIVFMPEMLGTNESCGKGKTYINWVNKASSELMMKGIHVPLFTALPSYWNQRNNSVTIVSNTGKVLSIQNKHEPYLNWDGCVYEALSEYKQKETTIIHIPNVHRIVLIICSEYLVDPDVKWSDILCRSLGVSLILVPSFSPGETAFFQSLNRYKEYGTTVVWGNCCGATRKTNKGIGGCCISELNIDDRFGKSCKCGLSCDNVTSCIFFERLSIPMTLSKIRDHSDEHELSHLVEKD